MKWMLLAVALVLAPSSFAADTAKCKFVRVAEWPVRLRGGLPIVEGEIDGKKVGVLIDTGAEISLITNAAAKRLGLETHVTDGWVSGFGGGASRVLMTRIEEVRIGGMSSKHLRVRVSGERPINGVDLILGDDFFQHVDVEFDYPKGAVRLFQPLDCGKDTPLSYWDPNAPSVPMEDERHVYVPVKVNGHEGRAMLDSGAAGGSVVSFQLASDAGIERNSPGVQASGCGSGIAVGAVNTWVARFDSLELGGETVHDAHLQLADYIGWRRVPEMILGSDFLRAHRVLIARSQRKVYFSYTGGTIFPATPAIDCDDLRRLKNTPDAIAALDQAIAANPKDAKALMSRALQRLRSDPAAARADLDSVIALEPSNSVALTTRALLRSAQKDYPGALEDSDAAIALGMRTPQVYVARAYVRRALGDNSGALAELDEAVHLDPHDVYALRVRGQFLFVDERFEAAEADRATLLAMRPNGFDSVWLALARERRGADNRATLNEGLKALGEEWPAPILKYLLGGIDGEALLAAAGSDADKRKGRECEARFYMAEHLVTQHHDDQARPLFEAARDACPRGYVEYDAALMELTKPTTSRPPPRPSD